MTVPEKSNSISSRQKLPLISISVAGLVVVIILIIFWPCSSCAGIFKQTAPSLETHLEIIKNRGAFVIGHEQIQELPESAQKVGLHLKTCCSVLDGGKLNPTQFQQCIEIASAYDQQIALVAQQVTDVTEAMEKGDNDLLQDKTSQINISHARS